MAQRQSTYSRDRPAGPARLGAAAQRAGLLVVAASLPLVVGTAASLFASAGAPLAGVEAATAAVTAAPTLGTDHATLFHLGTLALLAGCWVVGFGLVLDGLFD
jgi:hypothetical protein